MSASFDPEDLGAIPDPYAALDTPLAPAPDFAALAPSPTRAAVHRRRVAAVAGSIVCLSAIVVATKLRSGLDARLVVLGVALPVVVAIALLALLLSFGASASRGTRSMVAAVLAFALAAVLTVGAGDPSAAAMIRCVRMGGLLGAVPLALGIVAMRHSFVTGATWRTAALGMVSGLVGAAALRAHCPNDALVHLVVGHGLPVALAVAAALAIGPRFTRA